MFRFGLLMPIGGYGFMSERVSLAEALKSMKEDRAREKHREDQRRYRERLKSGFP